LAPAALGTVQGWPGGRAEREREARSRDGAVAEAMGFGIDGNRVR
jgi:hypothetical protein